MHNLCLEPRATGVRQIHKLHTELPATWAERKSAGPWRAIKVNPLHFLRLRLSKPNKQSWNSVEEQALKVPDVFIGGYFGSDRKAHNFCAVYLVSDKGYSL